VTRSGEGYKARESLCIAHRTEENFLGRIAKLG